MTTDVAGYTCDTGLPASPVSTTDLDLLLETLLWTDADAAALARAGAVLGPQVDEILDLCGCSPTIQGDGELGVT
jgi:hypothetical protein